MSPRPLLLFVAAIVAALMLGSPGAAAGLADEPADVIPPTCPLDPETGECISDRDRDGRVDSADNCPDHWNPYQEDADGDGLGDACDPTPGGGSGGGGGGGVSSCTAIVVLYEHTNYGGRCWGFNVGEHAYVGDAANDQASSIFIQPGYFAVLFTHRDFGGANAQTPAAADPWSWTGVGNDAVSSLLVVPVSGDPLYYEGAEAQEYDDSAYRVLSIARKSCGAVGDGVKFAHPVTGRIHWLYGLKVRFCWDGKKVTELYSHEEIVDIRGTPFPFNIAQGWVFAPVGFERGSAGYYSTVVRLQGEFRFCTARWLACTFIRQPWIRIELFASGVAMCTTSYNRASHTCARLT